VPRLVTQNRTLPVVQPISLLSGDKVIHLNLAQLKYSPAWSGTTAKPTQPELEDEQLDDEQLDDEQLDDEQPPASIAASNSGSSLTRLIITGQAELEALAENGLVARRDTSMLASLAKRFEALGLLTCSTRLHQLHEQLASSARLAEPAYQQLAAQSLLQSYYLLQLAAEQESVAAAAASVA